MIWCTRGLGYLPAWNMGASKCINAHCCIKRRGHKIKRGISWVSPHPLYMMTIITRSISYSQEYWVEIWHLAGTVKFKWWERLRCLVLSTILRLDHHLKIIKGIQGGLQQQLLTTRTIVCSEIKIQLRARMQIIGHSLATQEAQAMVEISSPSHLLSLASLRFLYRLRLETWSLSN
jgi:hypothetical protein